MVEKHKKHKGSLDQGQGRSVQPTTDAQGDFTRATFNPRKDYGAVDRQSGRVQLDTDFCVPAPVAPLLRTLLLDGEDWPEDRQLALLRLIRATSRLLLAHEGDAPPEAHEEVIAD